MDFLEIMDFVAYDIEKAHELIREISKAEALEEFMMHSGIS